MGGERPCRGTAVKRLQNRRFDLDEPLRVQESPDGRLQAPLLDSSEHDLSIRVAPEVVAQGLELAPQLVEVVDLAVEHHRVAAGA